MDISYHCLLEQLDKPLSLPQVIAGLTQMGVEVETTTACGDDTVLALEITPNRSDLFCYRGLARELAAGLQLAQTNLYQAADPALAFDNGHIDNTLPEPSGCERYFLREITGVEIKDSPDFIKHCLEGSGIKPKNNVVDIINYVMLEMGQPMHACDRDRLSDQICIRAAAKAEQLVCLDKCTRELHADDMVIADTNGAPIALAGIMGSQHAEITDNSCNIYIECAYFNPITVRKTGKRLNLTTDSSRRFELGADPLAIAPALARATELILAHAGGTVATTYGYDAYEPSQRTLNLPLAQITRYLGVTLESDFCLQALTQLGFEPSVEADTLRVTVPSWRLHDVKYPVCLIEEIAKVYDYSKLPNTFPKAAITVREKPLWQQLKQRFEQFFIGQGFNQVINFSFLSPGELLAFKPAETDPLLAYLTIERPLNASYEVLRTSQIPSLLNNYRYNKDRGIDQMKLFEIGRAFSRCTAEPGYQEHALLSGLMIGPVHTNTWQEQHKPSDSYDAKSLLFACLASAGLSIDGIQTRSNDSCLFDPACSGKLMLGEQTLGYFGEINPQVVPKKTKQPLIVFEVFLDVVKAHAHPHPSRFKAASKFPSIYRDLSFVCPIGFQSQTVIDKINQIAGQLVKQVTLTDVYQGKPLTKQQESLSFAIEFNSPDRTLNNDELTPLMNDIIQSLEQEARITLR